MKAKKLTALAATIIFIIMCFLTPVGCCPKKNIFPEEIEGTLNIVGSSSTQEVYDMLAKEFSKKHKKIDVIKSGSGSAQAAIAVANGTAQIGDLSRELNFDEQPHRFNSHIMALDGIAVCVNLKNKIKNLNLNQLNKIFTGKIKNWAEVGGKNAPIVTVGRDEASGTRANFEKIIKAKNLCSYLVIQDSNGKTKEKIKNDENAIGYISLSSVDCSLNTLAIDKIFPTKSNILNSSYGLVQPFIQITRKNCNDELVDVWLKFIGSNVGKQTIEAAKLIPVNEKVFKQNSQFL